MDLPLTGYKDVNLISISSDKFDLYIKGPYKEFFNNCKDVSTFIINSSDEIKVKVFDPQRKITWPVVKNVVAMSIKPLFYENTTYQIIIKKKQKKEIKIWHENKLIRDKIGAVDDEIMAGNINFENDIGFSEFKILVDGQEVCRFIIEVYPSKIDYKEDYIAMIN